jgi:hypothetical protein
MDKYGDAKLFELRHLLDNCPKAKTPGVCDQCKARYGERQPVLSASDSLSPSRRDVRLSQAHPWLQSGSAFAQGLVAAKGNARQA